MHRIIGDDGYLAPIFTRFGFFLEGNASKERDRFPAFCVAKVDLLCRLLVQNTHAKAKRIHDPRLALIAAVVHFDGKRIAYDVIGVHKCRHSLTIRACEVGIASVVSGI